MDKINIAESVESLNIGGKNVFSRFRKLRTGNHNGRGEFKTQAVEIFRMDGKYLLLPACHIQSIVGLFHILDGLVEVVDDHHDHFPLGLLFLDVLDDGCGAESQHDGDCGGEERQEKLFHFGRPAAPFQGVFQGFVHKAMRIVDCAF